MDPLDEIASLNLDDLDVEALEQRLELAPAFIPFGLEGSEEAAARECGVKISRCGALTDCAVKIRTCPALRDCGVDLGPTGVLG